MADARLQRAARTALLDGSPHARAAHLRERVRAGERSGVPCGECEAWECLCDLGGRERCPRHVSVCPSCSGTGYRPLAETIPLAAYCGDLGAAVYLGAGLPGPSDWESSYPLHLDDGVWCLVTRDTWSRGLSRWGRWVSVVAGAEAGKLSLPAWEVRSDWRYGTRYEPRLGPWESSPPRRALEAAEQWTRCPCEECLEAWRLAYGGSGCYDWLPHPLTLDAANLHDAARLTSEAEIRRAISSALVPLALGELK